MVAIPPWGVGDRGVLSLQTKRPRAERPHVAHSRQRAFSRPSTLAPRLVAQQVFNICIRATMLGFTVVCLLPYASSFHSRAQPVNVAPVSRVGLRRVLSNRGHCTSCCAALYVNGYTRADVPPTHACNFPTPATSLLSSPGDVSAYLHIHTGKKRRCLAADHTPLLILNALFARADAHAWALTLVSSKNLTNLTLPT